MLQWQAYATLDDQWVQKFSPIDGHFKFRDEELAKKFKYASREVKKMTGYVDACLDGGALITSISGIMLSKASKISAINIDWSVDQVQKIDAVIDWDFDYLLENIWAYWSARKFFEVCVSNNLGISFS